MNATRVWETTGQDWANHLSHAVSGNGTICLVALLSEKPDAATLRLASADLIDLQPVLGCRFDESREPPVWVSVQGEDWFREMTADSLRRGLEAIIQTPPTQGRQMDVTLLSTPDQTALCLRFDHAATDGGGAKRCLALLARCYRLRLEGRTATDAFPSDRSDGQIYARCGLSDYRLALKREAPAAEPVATVPYGGTEGQTVRYGWISLPLAAVKRADSTVNDRLLAAYILALSESCAATRAIAVHMTVDLRRYLDEESAPLACNLSGMAAIRVEAGSDSSFPDILAQVQRQTALLKSERVGLSSAATMTYLRTLPYGKAKGALLEAGRKSRLSGAASPLLSNLGPIAPGAMAFGDAAVTNILPLLPAMHAPAFMLGVGGYGDTLTISAGYYAEERPADGVERLLFAIGRILDKQPR